MVRKGRQSSSTSGKSASSSTDDSTTPLASSFNRVPSTASSAATTITQPTASPPSHTNRQQIRWHLLAHFEYYGAFWLVGCMCAGMLLGFFMGAGWSALEPRHSGFAAPWKQNLANRIRSTSTYQLVTFQGKVWDDWLDRFAEWAEEVERDIEHEEYLKNPSHPRIFAVLREAIVREPGGYVHPDLGLMMPAPCGASRGIGMVRDSYHKCQIHCIPGTASDKYDAMVQRADNRTVEVPSKKRFRQEEVLVRVPLGFQMTRQVALETLLPLVPVEVQRRASLHELDDAALLVLLLAHERGLGRYSRWVPYIASLPLEPSCGYSEKLKPYLLDTIDALREELGVDTHGWASELHKAGQYANKIADGLTFDYAPYLKHPDDVTPFENIKWALCQVASRGTAGSEKHGALRMVPLLDLVNHDANAGGFVELTGKERYRNGDFVDSGVGEDSSGTFVLRSMRHGQSKPLRQGQELLANYNVPHYSPLDWFVSLGFVPPERWGKWHKIEPALPRVRTDGPFSNYRSSTEEAWQEKKAEVIEKLRSMEL